MTFLTGSDGSVNLTTDHVCQFNTWSATATRAVHDVTKFGDSGRRRMLGIADITGSAGGIFTADSSNSGPGLNTGLNAAGATGTEITLNVRETNACKWVFNAIIDSIAANLTAGGDSTCTFNFQMAGGTAVVETWDES